MTCRLGWYERGKVSGEGSGSGMRRAGLHDHIFRGVRGDGLEICLRPVDHGRAMEGGSWARRERLHRMYMQVEDFTAGRDGSLTVGVDLSL